MTATFEDVILKIVCAVILQHRRYRRVRGSYMASKSQKKRTKKTNKTNKTKESFVLDEILIWITLAVSILILVSNFGFGGSVGEEISLFLMEAFGAGAYLFPFLLFGLTAFTVSNKHNRSAYVKTAAGIILFVLFCSLFEMISKAGGSLGESLAGMLTPALGIIGTYVVLMIFVIICMVVITGKSALKGVRQQGGKAYTRAKAGNAKRRERAKARQEIKEKETAAIRAAQASAAGRSRRKDRHVEGVSFDTTLKKKSPDVKELIPEAGSQKAAKDLRRQEAEEQGTDRSSQPQEFVISRADTENPAEFMESSGESEAPAGAQMTAQKRRARPESGELAKETAAVGQEAFKEFEKPATAYKYPPISLLKRGKPNGGDSDAHLRETARKLQDTLNSFGVKVTVTNVSCGPSVTRYELQPEQGVKVSKIVGLSDDIKLNLAAADIRIEAPIPGKAAVGIEVPNKENSTVMLRDLLETREFKESPSKISFAAGKDIAGKVVVTDIAKMPHLLVAGATGSGKSVCINTLVMSILYKAAPDEVKLIMIDPKVVELSVYNGIPHLMIPVVTDPKKAAGALNWAVTEMERRYQSFADYHVRDMNGYNQ